MSCLILVRHAFPNIDPTVPSADWTLSNAGREAAAELASALTDYAPKVVLSGPEPKIIGTAEVISEQFGVPVRVLPALGEHARRSAAYVSQADFEAAVGLFFACPAQVVFGEESADTAYERFASAIDEALAIHRDAVLVVTGGTVISLFVSRRGRISPLPLWRSLRMPTALVLNCEIGKSWLRTLNKRISRVRL
jgi:broad specificity phosphatase PhoE